LATRYKDPYTTVQGDTWDLIAWNVYDDEMQLHWLMEANPQHRETVIFPAGVVLQVPDIKVDQGRAPLPPWFTNG
jgi:phage tail protein X